MCLGWNLAPRFSAIVFPFSTVHKLFLKKLGGRKFLKTFSANSHPFLKIRATWELKVTKELLESFATITRSFVEPKILGFDFAGQWK